MQGAGGLAQIGWFLVRVIFGASLAFFHGWPKVAQGGVVGLAGMVAKLGLPYPKPLAWVAALGELAGGTLVAIGLLTRPAAGWAAGVMAVALYHHRVDPLKKAELAVLYLAVMLAAVLIGGGRFSLDAVVRRPGGGR